MRQDIKTFKSLFGQLVSSILWIFELTERRSQALKSSLIQQFFFVYTLQCRFSNLKRLHSNVFLKIIIDICTSCRVNVHLIMVNLIFNLSQSYHSPNTFCFGKIFFTCEAHQSLLKTNQ